MSIYLAVKEMWRNKGRFFLFSLVIALITVLVLFIAGLAQGLANANKEYLEKLDAELIVFQENVKLSTLTSRVGRSTLNQVKRIDGVEAVGPVGFSNGTIVFTNGQEDIDISLIGIEPGSPGGAPAFEGRDLRSKRANEAVIDGNLARSAGIQVDDKIIFKTIQGTDEEFYELTVVGISDGRQYFFQPSVFVPLQVWDRIRPQADPGAELPLTYNIIAVRLQDPNSIDSMTARLESQVDDVEVADIVTTYEAGPGYQAQQSTLNTQRGFTMLIGILVIGGFFQIQTLQKVPKIGMLKAVGTSNFTVGVAVVLQIILVTMIGVTLGSLGTIGLSLGLPDGIPVRFTAETIGAAVLSLMVIGPVGGLVSVRMALKVEPLMALGLSS
jgi:putative ABC transport system permease protein